MSGAIRSGRFARTLKIALLFGGWAAIPRESISDSRIHFQREVQSPQTDWSLQFREEDFEIFWRGAFSPSNAGLEVPGPGVALNFSKGSFAAGGLRGLAPHVLGRRLSVFSIDAELNAPGVGAGAQVEGVFGELAQERGRVFVAVARDVEGSIRSSASLQAPIGEGRSFLNVGAYSSEEGSRELSVGGRGSFFEVLASAGRTLDGPETSISIAERERRAAARATWRTSSDGRELELACGARIPRGRFAASRVEITGSPLDSGSSPSRARCLLRGAWGPWRVFAGGDTRRLASGRTRARGDFGFTKAVCPGVFATTDFGWDTSERWTPGTAAFTLAGRIAAFEGSIHSEITARSGRGISISIQRGKRIRSRVAVRIGDRANGSPSTSIEVTLTRAD